MFANSVLDVEMDVSCIVLLVSVLTICIDVHFPMSTIRCWIGEWDCESDLLTRLGTVRHYVTWKEKNHWKEIPFGALIAPLPSRNRWHGALSVPPLHLMHLRHSNVPLVVIVWMEHWIQLWKGKVPFLVLFPSSPLYSIELVIFLFQCDSPGVKEQESGSASLLWLIVVKISEK